MYQWAIDRAQEALAGAERKVDKLREHLAGAETWLDEAQQNVDELEGLGLAGFLDSIGLDAAQPDVPAAPTEGSGEGSAAAFDAAAKSVDGA